MAFFKPNFQVVVIRLQRIRPFQIIAVLVRSVSFMERGKEMSPNPATFNACT